MTWTATPPRQSGFFGILVGSVPDLARVVWSVAGQCRTIYRHGSPYRLTELEEQSIRLWCGPVELPPVPEANESPV